MFCDQCGKEIKPGAKFCNGCGAPVNVADVEEEKQVRDAGMQAQQPTKVKQNNPAPAPKKKSKKLLFIILGIVAAVIIIIVLASVAMVRSISSDKDAKELYDQMQKEGAIKDAYDVAGMTEEEFLEKTGYTKDTYGTYPNIDEYVFTFNDGNLMSIIILEDSGREYTFKGISIGDVYSEGIDGFSKIEDPLGREDENSHYYRDETYPNYLLTISCHKDGTIEGIRYIYLDDEDWEAVAEEAEDLKAQYGDEEIDQGADAHTEEQVDSVEEGGFTEGPIKNASEIDVLQKWINNFTGVVCEEFGVDYAYYTGYVLFQNVDGSTNLDLVYQLPNQSYVEVCIFDVRNTGGVVSYNKYETTADWDDEPWTDINEIKEYFLKASEANNCPPPYEINLP